MAVTKHAAALPDADRADAVVVAITGDGSEYVGARRTTEAELAGRVKAAVEGQNGKRVYVKADAHAKYGLVQRAFESARSAGAIFLLTDQKAPAGRANPLPPTGIRLRGKPDNDAVPVQALDRAQPQVVQINGKSMGAEDLPGTIARLAQQHGGKPVHLEADVEIAFQDVVRILDACREAGAEVYLATLRRQRGRRRADAASRADV